MGIWHWLWISCINKTSQKCRNRRPWMVSTVVRWMKSELFSADVSVDLTYCLRLMTGHSPWSLLGSTFTTMSGGALPLLWFLYKNPALTAIRTAWSWLWKTRESLEIGAISQLLLPEAKAIKNQVLVSRSLVLGSSWLGAKSIWN